MRTNNVPSCYTLSKGYPYYVSDLALWLTLISSNYPYLEHIFMVPKVFEPLNFYCIWKFGSEEDNTIVCIDVFEDNSKTISVNSP